LEDFFWGEEVGGSLGGGEGGFEGEGGEVGEGLDLGFGLVGLRGGERKEVGKGWNGKGRGRRRGRAVSWVLKKNEKRRRRRTRSLIENEGPPQTPNSRPD